MVAEDFVCKKVAGFPDALQISYSGALEQCAAYAEGLFHVQDLSSQLCCAVLGAKPEETVFDLCAAPGGKSFTIAEQMENKGRLLAFDLHENRVRLIKKGASRLGLDCIRAAAADAKCFHDELGLADRVLCDVPCSGLGVIRRKPEIKYRNPADYAALPDVQYEILCNAARYVKPGGMLLYSTCTLSRAENNEVAERFLKEHTDFHAGKLPKYKALAGAEIIGGFQATITPELFNGDGFFLALFGRGE